jgi:MoaA/NifB/PqqE/SkfB family radical SAM enzyme
MRFRRESANGRIPILECVKCWELKKISKEKAKHSVEKFRLPYKGIMVENTAACNLACVGCGRTHRPPMAMKMKLPDISKVAEIVRDLEIQKVAYLKLGEPFLSKHILEELKIIKKANPSVQISTSTTGMFINNDKMRAAALMFDVVVVSLDGSSQETAEKYQRGIDFSETYSNLRKLVEYRNSNNLSKPIIIWKYVVFNWNHKKGDVLRAIEDNIFPNNYWLAQVVRISILN